MSLHAHVVFLQDKGYNKKVVFSDNEASPIKNKLFDHSPHKAKAKSLFEDDDSGDELNFNIKKHYEGKKGQKVNSKMSIFPRFICN